MPETDYDNSQDEDEEYHLPDVCEAFALSEAGLFIQDHNFNSEPILYHYDEY